MNQARKRERELKRLKGAAAEVWGEQKEVLDRAAHVVRDARRQLAKVGREDLGPRVRETIDTRVMPKVSSGISATRGMANGAKERMSTEMMPAVSGALGSAVTLLELARDPRVREAVAKARQTGSKVVIKESSIVGRTIMISLGMLAAAGAAWVAWQTLRADDELWVGDKPEEPDVSPLDVNP